MGKEMSSETPRKVEIIEVIHVVALRGAGTEEDPARLADQYWSKEGELLAEKDVCRNGEWERGAG